MWHRRGSREHESGATMGALSRRRFLGRSAAAAVSATSLGAALQACGSGSSGAGRGEQAAEGTRITIGTHAVGGAFHALGSGVASLISRHTDYRGSVQPYSSPNAWMPDLNAGKIQLGLISGIDAEWAANGGPGFEEPANNLRLVLRGNELGNLGLVTTENTDITSLGGLEGKPVASDYGAGIVNKRLAGADLKSVGLDWKDVNQVPVADAFVALDGLRAGQFVASVGLAPTTPDIVELDAAIGLRPLPFGGYAPGDIANGVPEEAQKILDDQVPGATLGVAEAGDGMLEEDTVLIQYPLQVVASTHASDQAIHEALSAIWKNHEELSDVHPWGAEWDPKAMPTTQLPVPYHGGAKKFYRDAGVWTDEHERAQKEAAQ